MARKSLIVALSSCTRARGMALRSLPLITNYTKTRRIISVVNTYALHFGPCRSLTYNLQGDTATLAFSGSGVYIFGARKPEYVRP